MKFTDILTRHRIAYKQSNADQAEIRICCPFCSGRGETTDHRFRLGINVVSGKGHCFNCSWASSQHALNVVLRWLKEPHSTHPEEAAVQATPEPVSLPKDFQPLHRPKDDLDLWAYRYLLKRGITTTQMRRKHIGVCYTGKYAYRIVFPIYCQKHLTGLVARDFVGHEPRYLNSPGLVSLYNIPHQPVDSVILSEGVIKALRLEQATTRPSIAMLGHHLSEQQQQQLQQTGCRHVTIFPDPDVVGRTGAVRIAELLIEKLHLSVNIVWPVVLPADEQPLLKLQSALARAVTYSWEVRNKMLLGSI